MDSSAQPGFAPGTVLAERYRIIALLGRGGMGEVYRADDLKLGHAVALKFLPHEFTGDPAMLERFHGEVRNARQVSHPNVCRVYDIGEVEGRHFLTMEYIDGEDLASLLRRIGRLPSDKGLEIARQLCAGLAAAHDRGVLHRDLKPANIMIDGRGRARITDFGLAVSAGEGRQEFAGTPAYMAPEQLAGAAATVKSDLYSLGLVLYEVYTGRRAFEDTSVAELRRKHATSAIKLPSSITAEIDPAVERALLRCLEQDPAKRPGSALQVAAALPGGDPLAAAIAAGETPSPEMVAAAGAEEAAISPRTAAILIGAIIALLFCSVPFGRRASVAGVAPLARTPDGFSDHAQEVARRLGYTAPPADTYGWIATATSYLRYRAQHEPSPQRIRDLAKAVPGPYRFYFRQSPEPLIPSNVLATVSLTQTDPPMEVPGEILLALDGAGHLLSFKAVAPRFEQDAPEAAPPDWAALFAEAGLDMNRFKAAAPIVISETAYDARAAWEGVSNGIALHVDAAAFHGKPVLFEVAGPWVQRASTASWQSSVSQTIFLLLLGLSALVIPVAGLFAARRNMRLGRGDMKGALRVAVAIIIFRMLAFVFGAHHPPTLLVVPQVISAFAFAALAGAASWVSYVALEPLVRRYSPHLLISWARLLAGRYNDPLVGRDLAVGVLVGCALNLIRVIVYALPWWFNIRGMIPGIVNVGSIRISLGQPQELLSLLLNAVMLGIGGSMFFFLFLAVSRALFRRNWAAVTFVFLLSVALGQWQYDNLAIEAVMVIASSALTTYVLATYGPLAFGSAFFAMVLLAILPFDPALSTWYAARSALLAAIVMALAVYGLRCALAGRSLLAAGLEE